MTCSAKIWELKSNAVVTVRQSRMKSICFAHLFKAAKIRLMY